MRPKGFICALLSLVLLAGCGSEENLGPPAPTSIPTKLQPAARPEARESLSAATERIAKVASSADCEDVYTLNALSKQAQANVPLRCEALQALAGLEVVNAAAYGGGVVIDYLGEDGQTLSAVLILDADGLYHLATIGTEPSAGTRFAPRFDIAARAAADALREKDCGAFRKVASRHYEPDAESADICNYVAQNPLANLLGSHPRAQPKRLGGNGSYAFYELASAEANFTLLMERQSGPGDGTASLPTGVPQYTYLDTYLVDVGTIGLAKPKESIAAAAQRITKTASSGDCDEVYTLNPLSRRPGWDVPTQCEGFQALARFDMIKAAAYGGGGVIDYVGDGGQAPSALVILDADGRYHLGAIDGFRTHPSIGTPFARQFDAAAKAAVDALGEKDCEAFRKVALRRFGPGADSANVCAYVAQNPIAGLLESYPQAQPRRLGGNSSYAFYSLGSPDATFSMVLARESEYGSPPGARPLDEDAPEYGYVDAFLTSPSVPVDPES